MANCHDLFQGFQKEISIPSKKRDRMLTSKDNLRERIRKHFKEKHPDYTPKFYIQGSHKMKTGIRTKEDICDLDDGVYFLREPDVTATTLQGWIWDAVNGYTDTEPEHRRKCIRNIFASDYEIDMPVYYKVDDKDYQLAVKDNGWEDSDSKAFISWFNKKKDKDGKIICVIKELKAWCDHIRNKMPSGLAMTILAINAMENIVFNERDDITLNDILREIKKAVNNNFECVVPALPNDNLFQNYDSTRKENFLNSLSDFVDDAEKALKEENQLKASKLWRKHLGDRFPEGADVNEKSHKMSAFAIGAGLSKPWCDDK